MENIYSYVREMGDVPFSGRPLNEADNLVFCVFCYLDLSGAVPPPGRGEISLLRAAKRYFGRHGIPATCEDDGTSTSDALAHLFLRMALAPRYRDIMLSAYTDLPDPARETEFSALCIRYDADHIYVAFRGTSDRLMGWKEDFRLAVTGSIPSAKTAASYLKTVAGLYPDCFLEPGGHSKGGYQAVYAAAAAPRSIRRRILTVWSNDGAGLAERQRRTAGYAAVRDRIRFYVPAASIAGMVYPHEENYQVTASCARGLVQHDAKTWIVRDGHFVILEKRTRQSILAERKIRKWMDRWTAEEMMRYTDIIFDALSASGAETFPELVNAKKDAVRGILAGMRGLSGKEKRWLRHFLLLLAQTSLRLRF